MDFETMQIPLIFVAFFIIASVILSLVYKFGMKEKSYEEALAEQRQSTQSLLGIKQKPKDKKSKKTNKKIKEKDSDDNKIDKPEVKSILKPEKQNNNGNQKQETKPKIKFIKEVQKNDQKVENDVELTLPTKVAVKEKPAVVKKSEPTKLPVKEKIVPAKKEEQAKKDTIKEKAVSIKKDEQSKKEIAKEKQGNKKDEPAKEKLHKFVKKEDQQPAQEEIQLDQLEPLTNEDKPLIKEVQNKEEQSSEVSVDKVQVKPVVQNKREPEEKVAAVTKLPLTNGYIVNPTKDKKKKKNELNALQQLTAAPGGPGMAFILNMVHKSELCHGDIQMLIDVLLNKQLDAPAAFDDWSEGKSDPVQKLKKQLAEKEKALADEQETLVGVQIKLKEIRNEQLSERSSLNHKIKGLEEQLQNQQIEIHACNNRYHVQGQQLQQAQVQLNEERMKLHSLREELGAIQIQRQQLEMHIAQESEVIIAQLRADIQEFSARNEQLVVDINHIQKVAADNEAACVAQLNNITQELAEKSRQLEELRVEITNKNELLYRQEGELKSEIGQINAVMQQQAEEIRKTEQGKEELMEEISNLKKQKTISNKVITQLKVDIEKLQQEKSQNEASIENNRINETEVLNLKNELASVKNQLEETEKKFKAEVEGKANLISKLESEVNEQQTKNNELRNKNYKIMEALNAAESRIKNGQVENADKEKSPPDDKTLIESQKKFLARLLPEVNGLEDISSEKWEEECLNLVSSYLESLRKPAGGDSSEGVVDKLQEQLDQEQISWKAQIKSKDLELEALKEKLEKSQNLETINGSSVDGQ